MSIYDQFYIIKNTGKLIARISVTTSTPVDNNTWRYNVEVIESDGSGSKTNEGLDRYRRVK
jgi:hypothetical protein